MPVTVTHPRLSARVTRNQLEPLVRTLVYAPDSGRAAQLCEALAKVPHTTVQVAHGVGEAVMALVDEPPPRPAVFVVDLDHVGAGELLYLHAIRERGWCGAIVAIGAAPAELKKSLKIDVALPYRFTTAELLASVAAFRFDARTIPMPVIAY